MISTELLDRVLIVLAVLWLTLSLIIVIDRARRDRRTSRMDRLRLELLGLASGGNHHDDGIGRIARDVTATEFQQLARDGLPRDLEAALARELRARNGANGLRRVAEGVEGGEVWDRVAALQILVSSDTVGFSSILDVCLRSGSRNVAAAAVRMLIKLDDDRACETLIGGLVDGVYTRSRLAAALDRLSALRPESLAPLLSGEDASVRFWGVRLTGRLRAKQWAPRIRALASDPEPLVRRAAVEALGIIGEYRDRFLLIERFDDPAGMVRLHAARASVAFADAAVAVALTELLLDREWMVRAAARDALRRIGAIGRKPVLQALWHTDQFVANNAAEVLYLTGLVAAASGRVLAEPSRAADLVTFVARFFDVAGPHLREATLSHFTGPDRDVLLAHIRAGLPDPRRAQSLV